MLGGKTDVVEWFFLGFLSASSLASLLHFLVLFVVLFLLAFSVVVLSDLLVIDVIHFVGAHSHFPASCSFLPIFGVLPIALHSDLDGAEEAQHATVSATHIDLIGLLKA